jgi:hypothetical protein
MGEERGDVVRFSLIPVGSLEIYKDYFIKFTARKVQMENGGDQEGRWR